MKQFMPKFQCAPALYAYSLLLVFLLSQPGPASACSSGGCSCQVGSCSATYPCGEPCPCSGEQSALQATEVVEVPLGQTTITPIGANRALVKVSGFLGVGMDEGDL
jgi:hypothetical protein